MNLNNLNVYFFVYFTVTILIVEEVYCVSLDGDVQDIQNIFKNETDRTREIERKLEDIVNEGFMRLSEEDLFVTDAENNTSVGEARKRKKKKKPQEKGMMEKMLPMMIIPFMVSTSMIPMMLISLKFMLIKSAFIGKIAIILMFLNFFRRRIDAGGVYSHNVNANDVAMDHYGYHGMEYGAYVNKKKKRRRRR